MPVLIASDFGIGTPPEDDAPASVSEWTAFARRVLASGCPLMALVPFAPQRWPQRLARIIDFVHWSERTTARQVVRVLRERQRSTRMSG
jgi:hypothetical protein